MNYFDKNLSKMNFMMLPETMGYVMLPMFYYPSAPQFQKVMLPINCELNSAQEMAEKNLPIKLNITEQDLQKAGYSHKRNSWTQAQDKKLLELAKSEKMNWQQIGKKMGNRNSKMCYSRYRRLSYDTKKRWTGLEEKQILKLIQREGLNWKKISQQVPNRTPRQIQQHYEYCLRPNLNKSQWTIQQDLLLIQLLEKYGAEWKKIEEQMGNRTQNQIKNRYFGRLLKISEQKQRLKQETETSKSESKEC